MKQLRVGVIGAGQWAQSAHLPALEALPNTKVVALASVDRSEADRVAAAFGIDAVYDSGAELIARERLDLVSIVTPDDAHVADALAALRAGLHILCEKPLAVTVRDAELLANEAEQAAVCTKMGFTLRYAPAVIHLRELLQTGAIGEIRHVQAFQQNGQFLDPAKPFHWKMDPARTGGGAIVEYGVHTLDLLRWLIGEVDRVSATSRTYVPARPATDGGMREVRVDDSTAVLLEFVGGATGMCHASWATAGRAPGLEVRVYGSRGALKCALSDDLPGSEGLWIADAAEQRFEPVEIPVRLSDGLPLDLPWWQRFSRGLIEDFVAEIEGRTPASATFADGLAAQRLVEAVVIAAEERRWVDATC